MQVDQVEQRRRDMLAVITHRATAFAVDLYIAVLALLQLDVLQVDTATATPYLGRDQIDAWIDDILLDAFDDATFPPILEPALVVG